jgi:hypothetical protein
VDTTLRTVAPASGPSPTGSSRIDPSEGEGSVEGCGLDGAPATVGADGCPDAGIRDGVPTQPAVARMATINAADDLRAFIEHPGWFVWAAPVR